MGIEDNINNKINDIKEMKPMSNISKKPSKKRSDKRMYQSVNKFFFNDFQQKYIKAQKISDIEKNELERQLDNEMRAGENSLKNYCLLFIEENVLPLFKKYYLSDEQREIIKYNLEILLQLCGKDKNTYYNYYYPEANRQKKEIDRRKSVDALRRFRREFGVKKEDFNDEGIIQRLIENNYDIYKTFQKMFGI